MCVHIDLNSAEVMFVQVASYWLFKAGQTGVCTILWEGVCVNIGGPLGVNKSVIVYPRKFARKFTKSV